MPAFATKCGNCAVLGYYTASSGNFLLTFRDNLLVPSSGVKNSKESLLSQYGVYKGQKCGQLKVMPAHRVAASGWHGGECGSQCSFGEKSSVIEEILTGVTVRHRDGKEIKCNI